LQFDAGLDDRPNEPLTDRRSRLGRLYHRRGDLAEYGHPCLANLWGEFLAKKLFERSQESPRNLVVIGWGGLIFEVALA
jgi:hypothetical protein